MKIKLKNVYLLRFVVLALLFMALGWLLAYPFFEELEIVYVGVVVLVAIMLIRYLMRLASFVPNQVNYFVQSLLCHDYMIHFPPTKDVALEAMYDNMNQIIAQYRESLLDIEYKEQYYNRLLRIMTHELRNSITPVITLSSDMLKRPENYTSDRLHKGMEVIHEQCVGVKSFLDSYHKLTHLPAPNKTVIEMDKFFEHFQALQNHPSIKFSWGKGMTLVADETLVTLVLTNLIKNACEATEGMPDACVQVIATNSGGSPYIQVSDNGPGIPDEIREEIFLPFFTTKQEGTGIGLCLSRQIMRQHGGDLKLSLYNGKGATFMMTF
jgi:signal transduction histidine kinase